MLKWDQPQIIDEITVYADDDDRTTFYLLPDHPTYRLDDKGNPVARFLKYRFPIEHEGGKRGGGFLICDVEFTVPAAQEARVREVLQEQIDTEHRASGRDGSPPAVKIGRLAFTRGAASVTFLDTAGALVEKVANPASPSLYGKMILPITIEMSPEGATIAEQALQGMGGVLQVAYDLWTPVRLPPVTARVWFNASKFMHFHQEIDVEERFWDEDDYRETVRESFAQSDAGGVEIDPGTVTDQKVLAAVRDWAWKSLEDAVTRMVLGDIPAQNPEELRKLYTEEDIENISRDVLSSRVASFQRTYTEGQVMEWNPAPRGTLPNITSMTGPDGEPFRWEDFSATIDTNDPFFRRMTVKIRANADFDELPIDSVEVKVSYDKGDEHRTDEFSLRSADDLAEFTTFLHENDDEYRYQYQVNYTGESRRFESDPMTTDERSLVINVGDTGTLLVDVAKGDLSFDQVTSAQVLLSYEDPGQDVPRKEQVFTLDDQHPEHHWREVIFAPRRLGYKYQVKYFMADGREFVSSEMTGASTKLFVNDPFSATRTINVRGFGDFADRIQTIFVDLKYRDDVNDYTQTRSIALNKSATFDDWSFPVIAETGGRVTYRANIQFTDGTVEEIDETEVDGDTVMLGDVVFEQDVMVLPNLIDFAAFALVKVTLHYRDDTQGIDETDDLIFQASARTPQVWTFPYKDKSRKRYTWSAQYFPATGGKSEVGPTETADETIVLPATAG